MAVQVKPNGQPGESTVIFAWWLKFAGVALGALVTAGAVAAVGAFIQVQLLVPAVYKIDAIVTDLDHNRRDQVNDELKELQVRIGVLEHICKTGDQ